MAFGYWEPGTMAEAISLLTGSKGQALPLAGGTDLLLKIRRSPATSGVVNLKRMAELKGIFFDGQKVTIGSLTTVSALLQSIPLRDHFPVLLHAARALGTPQIRNLATIGGNLCNASPAADLSVALLAYDAQLKITGPAGPRTVPVNAFFTSPGKTVLKEGEILTAVEIEAPPLSTRGVFLKHGLRKSHEIALVNVAVLLTPLPGGDKIATTTIALGAVAPVPLRIRSAEDLLANVPPGDRAWSEAAELVKNAISPIDDVRSTAAYRRQIAAVLTRRALGKAWEGSHETHSQS